MADIRLAADRKKKGGSPEGPYRNYQPDCAVKEGFALVQRLGEECPCSDWSDRWPEDTDHVLKSNRECTNYFGYTHESDGDSGSAP